MNDHVPGPNFAKPSGQKAEKDKLNKAMKLKLIRLEIQESEAIKLLKQLCIEGLTILEVDNEIVFDDLLGGILFLANIYKRVGNSKNDLKEDFKKQKLEHQAFLDEQKQTIQHLESIIVKLRNENAEDVAKMVESRLQYEQRIKTITKQTHDAKEKLSEAIAENEELKSSMKAKDRKLMDVPRLEEQYLRSARGMVRQQEVEHTHKELVWKKMEVDVKALSFWKSKAKGLEETVTRQQLELESLQSQSRLTLSKLQTMMIKETTGASMGDGSIPFTRTRRPSSALPAAAASSSLQRVCSATSLSASSAGGRSMSTRMRPTSAPMGNKGGSSNNLSNNNDKNTLVEDMAVTENGSPAMNGYGSVRFKHNTLAQDSTATAELSTVEEKKNSLLRHKSMHEINANEVVRLREVVKQKDEQIIKLSQKLSTARAHPLLNAAPANDSYSDSYNYNTYGGTALSGSPSQSRKNNNKNGFNAKNFFKDLDENDGELESISPEFLSEEARLEEARIQNAVKIQQDFNNRLMRKSKKADPSMAFKKKSY